MWILITVPLMIVGVAIAVLPVLWGSVRFQRAEQAGAMVPVQSSSARIAAAGATAELFVLGVSCPLCTARISGSTNERLVDAVERHAWREHGIPSASHILESARSA